MNTGDIIKKLRNEKKITQTELGVILGVNTSSIQKYESGATKNLKLETIRTLCSIFNMPPIAFVFPEMLNADISDDRIQNALSYIFKESLGLNSEGQKKMMEYLADIMSIEKYQA